MEIIITTADYWLLARYQILQYVPYISNILMNPITPLLSRSLSLTHTHMHTHTDIYFIVHWWSKKLGLCWRSVEEPGLKLSSVALVITIILYLSLWRLELNKFVTCCTTSAHRITTTSPGCHSYLTVKAG